MPSNFPLLIDLSGVARLADVQRPVASVWRSRFASAGDPFPPAVSEKGGRAFFDAMSVAQWLARTDHGNNPHVVADAAASAAPADFDIAETDHVAAVDALLALRAASGEPVGGSSIDEVRRRATAADPDDSCLLTEVSTARSAWAEWADLLADAAYSPLEASRVLEHRHAATRSSAGSTGPLTVDGAAMLAELAQALVEERAGELAVSAGIAPSLADDLAERVGDDIDIVPPRSGDGRAIRRRMLCAGVVLVPSITTAPLPRLSLVRLPSGRSATASAVLRDVDDLALAMRDHDRAVLLAPAAVLTDAASPADVLARTDVLRSGRVRAIVRLPPGLVTSAPREALALWVLGRETGDVPVADRFTAVADLSDHSLTAAARADLTSDVIAAMGSARDVRAHAFRFARLVRTTSLLAARGALIAGRTKPTDAAHSARDLPARLDRARTALGDGAPTTEPTPRYGAPVPPAHVGTLIAERHLRVLPGTRIAPDEPSATGLIAVYADDLDAPGRIGDRRVDPFDFAARHPSTRLTIAGDVVFRAGPTPRAWVDPDGSKVVAHPARVLRINPADPGGLVPELVAADIDRSVGGPGSWRRWLLRRVAPPESAPLRAALADVAARRAELERRLDALDTYSDLLTAGVVSGTVTLTDNVADAARDQQ